MLGGGQAEKHRKATQDAAGSVHSGSDGCQVKRNDTRHKTQFTRHKATHKHSPPKAGDGDGDRQQTGHSRMTQARKGDARAGEGSGGRGRENFPKKAKGIHIKVARHNQRSPQRQLPKEARESACVWGVSVCVCECTVCLAVRVRLVHKLTVAVCPLRTTLKHTRRVRKLSQTFDTFPRRDS